MTGNPVLQHVLWLVAIRAAGAIAQRITPRTNSPVVLELIGGVLLGNLGFMGVSIFEPMKQSGFLNALSQFGVSFLLFQICLESTIVQMRLVGLRALLVSLTVALGMIAVAVAGKLACGLTAGTGVSGWVVGVGMIPRGEVLLLYASMGLALGAVSKSVYSSLVIVVMVTTMLAPIVLIRLLRGAGRTSFRNGI